MVVVLDTSILIDALRRKSGETVLQKILEKVYKSDLAISVLSVQELYQGKSVENPDEEENLKALVFPLEVLAYSYEVARQAGEIVRISNYTVQFADAAIAATALVNNAQLATLNPKDFAGIEGLEIYKVLD